MYCFIHAGLHKTGSSSLQELFFQNAKALQQEGILYPTQSAQHRQHVILAKALQTRSQDNSSVVRAFEAEIATKTHDALLLSAEWISTTLRKPEGSRLVEYVRALGYHPIVFVYLRHQPQMINSQYLQGVRTFNFSGSLSDLIALKRDTYPENKTFLPQIDRFGDDIVFRPFNEELRRNGVERDFLAELDRRLNRKGRLTAFANRSQGRRENVSTEGPILVEVLRGLRRRVEDALSRRERMLLARKIVAMCTRRVGPEATYCGLDTALARAIEKRHRAGNDAIARAAWNMSWEDAFGADIGQSYQCNDLHVTRDRAGLLAALAMIERLVTLTPGWIEMARQRQMPEIDPAIAFA
ncbi:hypothetical protein [Prosthecodimorpha staleyi]|uniref:Uncharacterized protein n=1 Tax=Prosthecodimorpha staleyi TaxID=2840188 RepID=A0A947D4R8_9HYPH|nr:hypothetical protein [Prosthecodimorpha staleyi]MBT9290199.1 hypothetical protein [Prosthecodimorpha staleyi]